MSCSATIAPRSAQVVKQPDVLMLHYLLPDELAPGSLEPNLDYYEPRTAHGSTLSPGVHAALLARAGRLNQAMDLLRLTSRIDLDDIGGVTAAGLHLRRHGQRLADSGLRFRRSASNRRHAGNGPGPRARLDALELRVRFRDSRVRVRVRPDEVQATAEPPITALTAPASACTSAPKRTPSAGPRRPNRGLDDHGARRAGGGCRRRAGAQRRCGLADLFDASVAALHVQEDGTTIPRELATAAGVELYERNGSPIEQITAACQSPDVAALVLGARGIHCGAQPAGRTALEIITQVSKPVLVVPPHAEPRQSLARILVPLDGTSESAQALREIITLAHVHRLEVLVLHVYSPDTVPAFSNHAPHATHAREREFLSRNVAPPHDRVTLLHRLGVAADDIAMVSRETSADLIALAWRQNLIRGSAHVVSETLAHSNIPVLLLPVP